MAERPLDATDRILGPAAPMLQPTSAGGTYPMQPSPEFLDALHPFLPRGHAVDARCAG